MGGSNTSAGYYIEQLYPDRKLPISHLNYKNVQEDAEKYIYYTASIYLYTLIYSDYREYLNLSRIVTAQQSAKLVLLDKHNPLPKDFIFLKKDIQDLNAILFKEDITGLITTSLQPFKISSEAAVEIWEWVAGIILLGLFQQMKHNKLNLSGLIQSISKSQSILKTTLSPNTIKQIQLISTDNRKRSKTYTRGGKESTDKKSVYYFLSIIGFMALIYILFAVLKK